MKRFFWLASIVLFAAFAGGAQAQQGSEPDCVLAAVYPPFIINDKATKPGISIEILRAAAKRAGRQISVEFLPFQRALKMLATGSDCMFPVLFRNETREDQFRWIAAYHSAELRFLTTGPPVNTIEEGRQLDSIVVEINASSDQFLSNLGFTNLVRITESTSSARMLETGRVSAWSQSATAANRVWQSLGIDAPLNAGDAIYSVPIYVTANTGFPDDVATAYQTAIEHLVNDGTVARIISQYD